MYINNKLLIGKNNENEVFINPKMANRHGLISGASGSGKTITLKVMAESFSKLGTSVFLVDVKGDLAGMNFKGDENPNITERLQKLNIDNFTYEAFPTTFWDVYGKNGHPIRTTVSNVGSKLLAKMLNLTDAQEGVLTIAFKIAEDENLEIIDLNDLKSLLNYVGDKRKEYTLKYGNINVQSVGSIQRNILSLEEEGGDYFFGKPDLNIKDFIHFDGETGYGNINILDATTLFQKPNLYATFLLWLLTSFYQTLPEVGDLEKPKIVLFFDEAHIIFQEIPQYLMKQIIQIVKLIRSKGVGLYFISQSPSDIPDEILSQLGNRVQHVLRYYTKTDEKAIKAASESFRENPNYNTKEEITKLKTGEALVSFQNEYGEPNIVEKVTILPPQSRMGTITDEERQTIIKSSNLYGKYEEKIDEESAFEKINKQKEIEQKEQEKLEKEKAKQKENKKTKSSKKSFSTKVANKVSSTLGRKIGNAIWKGLFK